MPLSKEAIARNKKLAKYSGARSIDAPPKPIGQSTESEIEVFVPIPPQDSRGKPDLALDTFQFCQWCRDVSSELIQCQGCKRRICLINKLGAAGCVLKETITPEVAIDFKCPECQTGPANVWFQGFSMGGKHNKVLWPAAIVTMSLYATDDGYYASRRIELDIDHEYKTFPNNLRLTHLTMKGNSQCAQRKRLEPVTTFLTDSMIECLPANVIVFIDTHSDGNSGYLQYSGGRKGGNSAPVDEVLAEYLGDQFIGAMTKSSKAAEKLRANDAEFRQKYANFQGAVVGGLRVLLVMSCGPAMTKEAHRMRVKKLVTDGLFDLVLGFSGETTLPEFVMDELLDLIRAVTVDSITNIWTLLGRTFKHSERLLNHSPLIAVFQDGSVLRCIELGLHEPPHRVLGLKLWCGKSDGTCHPGPGDLFYKNSRSGTPRECVKQKCRRCGFNSDWVLLKDVEWVKPFPGSRRVFWHDYPISPQQQLLFASPDSPPSSDREGEKPQSKKGKQKRERGMSGSAFPSDKKARKQNKDR